MLRITVMWQDAGTGSDTKTMSISHSATQGIPGTITGTGGTGVLSPVALTTNTSSRAQSL